MKTIAIRLSDVDVAMLVEVQKRNRLYRDLTILLRNKIREEYERISPDA